MDPVSENMGDEATRLFRLLLSCRPYSQQKNALAPEHLADRTVVWLFKAMAAAFAGILGFGFASWIPALTSPMVAMARWSFDSLTLFGLVAALVYPALFWVRRKHRSEDRLHHVAGAFGHPAKQVASLTAHPLPLLKKVERFCADRPLGVQGGFASVLGEGALTIPGVAALVTTAKGISDLFGVHPGPVWVPVGAALWTVLGAVVLAVVVSRAVSGTARYQSRLLAEAIAQATDASATDAHPGPALTQALPDPSGPPTLQIVPDVARTVGQPE